MDKRLELQYLLESIANNNHVYFQPPPNIKIRYPAIIYCRNGINNLYANDYNYQSKKSYSITVIDEDPDSELVDKISKLPWCSYDRSYSKDNLNYDVFTLFY